MMWKSLFHVEQLAQSGPDGRFCGYRCSFPRRGLAEVEARLGCSTWNISCIAAQEATIRRLDRDGRVLAVKAKKDDDSEEGRGEEYLYNTVIQNLLVGV